MQQAPNPNATHSQVGRQPTTCKYNNSLCTPEKNWICDSALSMHWIILRVKECVCGLIKQLILNRKTWDWLHNSWNSTGVFDSSSIPRLAIRLSESLHNNVMVNGKIMHKHALSIRHAGGAINRNMILLCDTEATQQIQNTMSEYRTGRWRQLEAGTGTIGLLVPGIIRGSAWANTYCYCTDGTYCSLSYSTDTYVHNHMDIYFMAQDDATTYR